MFLIHQQGNTQVHSPFGTIVVEQRDGGFRYPRRSDVPEPTLVPGNDETARTTPPERRSA